METSKPLQTQRSAVAEGLDIGFTSGSRTSTILTIFRIDVLQNIRGPSLVVMLTLVGDEHFGFEQGCEVFTVQELISKLAIEQSDIAVFPEASRLNREVFDT